MSEPKFLYVVECLGEGDWLAMRVWHNRTVARDDAWQLERDLRRSVPDAKCRVSRFRRVEPVRGGEGQ